MTNEINLADFLRGYVECALWSTTDTRDEGGNDTYQLDDEFSDVSEPCREAMRADCADFIAANSAALAQFKLDTGADDWRIGFLFWLTREGHGSGFWEESGRSEEADQLSDACQPYGGFPLYGDFEEGVVKSHHYG